MSKKTNIFNNVQIFYLCIVVIFSDVAKAEEDNLTLENNNSVCGSILPPSPEYLENVFQKFISYPNKSTFIMGNPVKYFVHDASEQSSFRKVNLESALKLYGKEFDIKMKPVSKNEADFIVLLSDLYRKETIEEFMRNSPVFSTGINILNQLGELKSDSGSIQIQRMRTDKDFLKQLVIIVGKDSLKYLGGVPEIVFQALFAGRVFEERINNNKINSIKDILRSFTKCEKFAMALMYKFGKYINKVNLDIKYITRNSSKYYPEILKNARCCNQ